MNAKVTLKTGANSPKEIFVQIDRYRPKIGPFPNEEVARQFAANNLRLKSAADLQKAIEDAIIKQEPKKKKILTVDVDEFRDK